VALSEHQERPLPVWEWAFDRQEPRVPAVQADAPRHLTDSPLARRSDRIRWIHLSSAAGLAVFVAVALAFHGLRGDLNPAEHTISEYSLGRDGWLMRTAFAALATGVLTTVAILYLRFRLSPLWGSGLLLLTCTAVGLLLDAGYNTDRPHVLETADGRVHGIGMLIVCVTLPAASFLLGRVLAQGARTTAQARRVQVLAAAQIVAIVGFEMSPMAVRGLIERVAITMAVATLVVLRSVALSATDDELSSVHDEFSSRAWDRLLPERDEGPVCERHVDNAVRDGRLAFHGGRR